MSQPQYLQSSTRTLTSLVVLQLRYLDASNNNIAGTLPSMWSNLQQVSMLLLLLHCLLKSSPPLKPVVAAVSLELYLEQNQLVRILPESWNKLSKVCCSDASFQLAVTDRLAKWQALTQSQMSTVLF